MKGPRPCHNCGGAGVWKDADGDQPCRSCNGAGTYTPRRQRTVRQLLPLLLTKREQEAIAYAVGNSTADPDWWDTPHGRGQRAATQRALEKLTRQAAARERVS